MSLASGERMKIYTCVYRIYVNMTEEGYCPLPIELTQFCQEGITMECRHYKKLLKKSIEKMKEITRLREGGVVCLNDRG